MGSGNVCRAGDVMCSTPFSVSLTKPSLYAGKDTGSVRPLSGCVSLGVTSYEETE